MAAVALLVQRLTGTEHLEIHLLFNPLLVLEAAEVWLPAAPPLSQMVSLAVLAVEQQMVVVVQHLSLSKAMLVEQELVSLEVVVEAVLPLLVLLVQVPMQELVALVQQTQSQALQ